MFQSSQCVRVVQETSTIQRLMAEINVANSEDVIFLIASGPCDMNNEATETDERFDMLAEISVRQPLYFIY